MAQTGRRLPLSHSGRLKQCATCRSIGRHRAFRKLLHALGPKRFKQVSCLNFSGDPTTKPTWFGRYEISTYGRKNSIDVQRIDRPDASYDVIICNHVLEHVPDDRSAVRELGRILSDRGFLFLSVPGPGHLARTEDWGWPDPARSKHYREYGPEFVDLLQQELPHLSIIEVWATDDTTRDVALGFVLTRNGAWYRRFLALPVRTFARAQRALA